MVKRIKYCLRALEFTEAIEFILSVGEDSVDLSKFYLSGDFFVPFCVGDKKENRVA